jgi:colicin import membrane protein
MKKRRAKSRDVMKKFVDARVTVDSHESKNTRTIVFTYMVSILCHVIFFAILTYGPTVTPQKKIIPSVIDVSMVTFSTSEAATQPAKSDVTPATTPDVAEKVQPEIKPEPEPEVTPEPVVTIKKQTKKAVIKKNTPKKLKRSLKKKTFKRTKVLKSAIRRIEKDIDKSKPDPLKTAMAKLRQKVGDKDVPLGRKTSSVGGINGKNGLGLDTGPMLELIDIYRVEIAYQIQKNWAFSDQLAGGRGDLKVSLVFKIMPDGEIRDIFFTDRSGNNYLDESAYNAIKKSTPVKPHPEGARRPYVEMGLEFTPEGIN